MNSINQQQGGDHHQDVFGREAVEKIKELVGKAKNCFFCTVLPNGGQGGARPMNVRKVDEDGNLWFLSASDSHQNQELAADPSVKLYFQGSPNSDFLTLSGRAAVSTDRKMIEELWEPVLKTWFTGGIDDPRITVIQVTPTDGYYWDTKNGGFVAGIKMMIGAVIGQTMDDSVEGRVQV